MKNGKIILGAAAFMVTAASALAFKTSKGFGAHPAFGRTAANGKCFTTTCSVTATGGSPCKCHTLASGVKTVLTAGGGRLWTAKTINGHCGSNLIKWTCIN